VFFNTRSALYMWYMHRIFLLKIHVSRHFNAYIPPLHWVIFLPWLLCLWPLWYVDMHMSRLVFIHHFSLKQAFMSYRYFHIIFIIFGYFLCFSTLDRPCISDVCITYFCINFVFLATTSPLHRPFIHHIFHLDKPVFHTFISM